MHTDIQKYINTWIEHPVFGPGLVKGVEHLDGKLLVNFKDHGQKIINTNVVDVMSIAEPKTTPHAPKKREKRIKVVSNPEPLNHVLKCNCAECVEWREYDLAHPELYIKLRDEALALLDSGRAGKIEYIWQKAWYDGFDGSKPNKFVRGETDHYRTRYARMLMYNEPKLEKYFSTHKMTCFSS